MPALDTVGDAGIAAATGEALLPEVERIAVIGRGLAHQVADEIAAAAAQ